MYVCLKIIAYFYVAAAFSHYAYAALRLGKATIFEYLHIS